MKKLHSCLGMDYFCVLYVCMSMTLFSRYVCCNEIQAMNSMNSKSYLAYWLKSTFEFEFKI